MQRGGEASLGLNSQRTVTDLKIGSSEGAFLDLRTGTTEDSCIDLDYEKKKRNCQYNYRLISIYIYIVPTY